jgi:hypothetical protein
MNNNNTMINHTEIAQTIINQLGGNKFCAMTGAKKFLSGITADTNNPYVRFRIGANNAKINEVMISLTPADTYIMLFSRVRGANMVVEVRADDVYADMLQPIFTQATGLYTSL